MRTSDKPKSFSKSYDIPYMQWLRDTPSLSLSLCSNSLSNYQVVVEVRLVPLQGESVSAISCFPEETSLLPGVSQKHLTHVQTDLNQEILLANPFGRYPHF
ncbi:hypothetical protein TNCV_4678161 [Trichonephila clavipes]|nr:hypothetical protein TNCV_4678161 [Trichonephila clavipes]